MTTFRMSKSPIDTTSSNITSTGSSGGSPHLTSIRMSPLAPTSLGGANSASPYPNNSPNRFPLLNLNSTNHSLTSPRRLRYVFGLLALVVCLFLFLNQYICRWNPNTTEPTTLTIPPPTLNPIQIDPPAVTNPTPTSSTPTSSPIITPTPESEAAILLSVKERQHYIRLQKMEAEYKKQKELIAATPIAPPIAEPEQPPEPRDLATLIELQNTLPYATTKGDSTGERLIIHSSSKSAQRFSYDLCSFTNVCAARDGIYLQVQSEWEYNQLAQVLATCFAKGGAGVKDKKIQPPTGAWTICHCFLPVHGYQPRLLPYWRKDPNKPPKEFDPKAPSQRLQTSVNPLKEMNKGHFLAVHKYVDIRHIAHWAQKLLLLQSIIQHSHAFPSNTSKNLQITSFNPNKVKEPATKSAYQSTTPWRPVSGMVIHNLDLPMTSHEENILQFSLQAMTAHDSHPGLEAYLQGKHLKSVARYHADSNIVFGKELDRKLNASRTFVQEETRQLRKLQASHSTSSPSFPTGAPAHMLCYERLSFVRAFGVIASTSADTNDFRRLAYEKYDLTPQLDERCPPQRVVLLYREDRGILNWKELVKLVESMTKKSVERITINGTSTSEEQIRLFASAGLLIGSHSSQLINVLFSHPSSSLIEVTPEYHNSDFSEYAHGMGVHFTYALGGRIEGGNSTPGMKACTELLMECEGDSYCILERRHSPGCQGVKSLINKKKNFYANLTAVKQAVQHSLDHLQWACQGNW